MIKVIESEAKEIKEYYRILICGGRHFDDYGCLSLFCDSVIENIGTFKDIEIVTGHCAGADILGEKYAKENGYKVTAFPAEWSKYGKSAGIKRNLEMLDYISQSDCVVIGFVSENSKGTKFTVENAQKRGIDTHIVKCNKGEDAFHLYEGVNYDGNKYKFNFDEDGEFDIVYLTSQLGVKNINGFNCYYYGYRVNLNCDKTQSKNFLKYIKTPNGLNDSGVLEMIENSVEVFENTKGIPDFDCIIETESSSKLVSLIVNEINRYENTKIIKSIKKSVVEFEFDWDKIRSELGDGEYFERIKEYLERRYKFIKNSDYFSISNVSPQYRKWIKPMLSIDSKNFDINDCKNILVVDDTVTKGSTLGMISSCLSSLGYKGNL